MGSSPTSQLKIRVPIQVSSTVYQSKIRIEIELNRNEKQIQQKRFKRKHRIANDEYDKIIFHVANPIIIIIIKKDRQCKAERGRLTPYQSEDRSPTLPTYRAHKAQVKHHKAGASGYTKSCTTYTTLPQIYDGKDHS